MIMVWVEVDGDGVALTTLEAITVAREVAEREGAQAPEAILIGPIGDQLETVLAELGNHGVARVHRVDGPDLHAFAAAAWAAAIVSVTPSDGMVVASGTPRGNEILAHVATRLDVAMAANVVTVDAIDPVTVSRQVLGGAALEEMRLDHAVAVLSIAGHAVEPVPAATATTVEVITHTADVAAADLRARVVRVEESDGDDTAALTGARVVIGAGRGAGSADGFADLLDLVDLLDGALGVSRVVTSLGWRPHNEQVGQTGSRITPDVYLACGISGAIQHWAGCQGAKTIIAVNTDPDAPMVTRADYAIVGDLHEVVPAINEELRRRTGRQ